LENVYFNRYLQEGKVERNPPLQMREREGNVTCTHGDSLATGFFMMRYLRARFFDLLCQKVDLVAHVGV
jgi:hypothetical protein